MYCRKCGSNNAFPAHDVNFRRDITVCPECKEVSWPVPTVEDLKRDVELVKEKMNGIENMPILEED